MIDLETLPLRIGSYERKDLNSRMFKNTGRNGFGCSINPAENLAIELLKKTGDIISYKRKIEQKS